MTSGPRGKIVISQLLTMQKIENKTFRTLENKIKIILNSKK
jgi:hypothetical protein